jgi:hypothetical protein
MKKLTAFDFEIYSNFKKEDKLVNFIHNHKKEVTAIITLIMVGLLAVTLIAQTL